MKIVGFESGLCAERSMDASGLLTFHTSLHLYKFSYVKNILNTHHNTHMYVYDGKVFVPLIPDLVVIAKYAILIGYFESESLFCRIFNLC